ncbi:glycosyltransferase [Leptothermofonsia sp. ETS-13]|uniref:glycosyltransferase n=1 Tax=Leptothermofonsia sp. ETS-13 TaxID=3035696 RepID=UPI003BA06918
MAQSLVPFVSVVIPVFNDARRLRKCLNALEQQSYPGDRYEVIVIDNGSDPAEKIAEVVANFPHAIAASEPHPGSYAARNRGIALAGGEIIAFTDADCIPASDWLEKGVRRLQQSPHLGLVAGRIEVFFEDNRITPVALYEKVTAFPQQRLLKEQKGGATANVFTFKTVIDRVGAFNPHLKARGDLEWGRRVYQAGYQQMYAEDVWVAHPARSSFQDLYRRTVRLVGGIYDSQRMKQSSLLKRNLLFLDAFFKSLVPPLMFLWNTLQDTRLQSLEQKIQVWGVMILVRYISAYEMLRLKLGGVSARG